MSNGRPRSAAEVRTQVPASKSTPRSAAEGWRQAARSCVPQSASERKWEDLHGWPWSGNEKSRVPAWKPAEVPGNGIPKFRGNPSSWEAEVSVAEDVVSLAEACLESPAAESPLHSAACAVGSIQHRRTLVGSVDHRAGTPGFGGISPRSGLRDNAPQWQWQSHRSDPLAPLQWC